MTHEDSMKVDDSNESGKMPASNLPPEKLQEKAKRWRQMNQKRFAGGRKIAFTQLQKEDMPPEHVRKVSERVR